jgi:intracellular sulfur oxidation DsrE/DsrF family protein
MTSLSRRFLARFLGTAAIGATLLPAAWGQAKSGANKVVFQVTDGDAARWNMVLNNVRNLQTELAADPPEVEVVVYGPAVAMLKAGSPAAERVAETLKNGVKVVACQNTMKNMKLVPEDMLPDIGYVPAGVVEVVRKQQQGWVYVRP